MTYKSEIGKFGEDIACKYLVENNFKVIERNFRQKWGEIDIIAKESDKTLVFVEVKTVKQPQVFASKNYSQNNINIKEKPDDFINSISAEEQLTHSKLLKLQRMASLYANHRPELIDDKKGWRIDLIALTIKDKNYVINHYKNISL